jgi:hypothetical protein
VDADAVVDHCNTSTIAHKERGLSKVAAKYYFFTDTNLLSPQLPADAFGPAGTVAGQDQYRTSSMHTATSDPMAYAVCDGIVCVQRIPGTSPALVNVILKPLVQPGLNFSPVKYIIYRGILEASLINGVETASPANNALTKSIWDTQAKKNKSTGTTANPPAEALGVGLTAASADLADTEPIDNLFYRTGVSFQLPPVNGGWSIGQFDKNGFGIEVLMDGLSFHRSLALTRKLENKISVATLTGSETPAEVFDHWHAKEQILGFMDPCAFYGSFFLAGIQAKTSTDTEFKLKAGNALYNDVLFPFANRNTAYLDIRNEHNFYFNYFGNYNDIIQVGNPLSPVDYNNSGWPILTLTSSNFPANNTTKARNAFQLRLKEGDNPKPLIYVSQGYRELHTKGDGFPEELTSAERFFDAFLPFGTGHATPKSASGPNSLTFVVPNVTGLGVTTPVSCYIRLKYLKQEQGTTTEPKVIQSANYLDNLIWPMDLKILFTGNSPIKSAVYEEEVYINAQTVQGLDFDFIGNLGIARDADNTSFFLVPSNIRSQKGPASDLIKLTGETNDYVGDYPNFVARKYPLERVIRSYLKLSGSTTVSAADFAADAEQSQFVVPDFDKLIVIVVANATYAGWDTNISAVGGLDKRFRTYLGIKNLQKQSDTLGVKYTAFELVLRGYALDSTGNDYEVREVGTDPANSANNVTAYTLAGA